MTGWRLPPPHGAWIDRARPLSFRFNGDVVSGFAGDTVASALLAQGVKHVGRSVKLHRPRGIVSCGPEEPCGLVDVGTGARRTPDTRATDVAARDGLETFSGNAWPSLWFDLAAVNGRLAAWIPAGFYYKTFKWPHWHWFEPSIRRMAGLGRAADAPDPDRYDECSVQVEVLVVGAGAAGLQAALAAARAGRQVLLLEADPHPGGWLAWHDAARITALVQAALAAGVQLQTRTAAFGVHDHRFVAALQSLESADDPGPVRERLWKIRAGHVVLATGAFERPMLFPDNDRPGVMLADAVQRYLGRYGVACGRRVLVAAACDAAYAQAEALGAAGLEVVALVDRRKPDQIAANAPAGIDVLAATAVVGVRGRRSVRAVDVAGAARRRFDVDLIAVHGGFAPDLGLYTQAGGRLRWCTATSMFVPGGDPPGVTAVGACAGLFDLDPALDHAARAVAGAAGAPCPPPGVCGVGLVPADTRPDPASLGGRPGKVFVDLQNDVAASDVDLAARENYRSVEHLKRYTTTGMGTDQGKTSNVNALVLLGAATARAPGEVGTTRLRPPSRPVTLGALAGARRGALYRPLKRLPARPWHVARGALFEEFGGWERPAAYPHEGETLVAAAEREAGSVRRAVGLFDGSPLGKIEVVGPDAAEFLDLMYVGTLSTLPVGGARYGALLDENGVVTDDGIVARLGPDHFWVNTTSGGADRVALGFEEWLQCEYVRHRVLVQPVTSSWANVTVAGPRAWALLERVGFDRALAPSAMTHMTIRQTSWRGCPARVLRASFSGELGYEVNLPPSRAPALLDALWEGGQPLGVCAYGVEALMVLRIEKGFLHVGGDTDGTTLPGDVGLARGIDRKAANFVGRRSLLRPAALDPDRLQLVGLQPVDRRTRLRVGAHLSLEPPPTRAEGHVTSSCWSPTLRQPVALAMVRGGTRRIGERLTAWHLGRQVPVEIVRTPFVDPAGERLHG